MWNTISSITLFIIFVVSVVWLYTDQSLEAMIAVFAAFIALATTSFFSSLASGYQVGLRKVFSVGVKGDYNHIAKAIQIDFLSISLRGLLEVDEQIIKSIANNRATVRILILDPDSGFVRERERQEGEHRSGRIKEECESTIQQVQEVINRLTSQGIRGGSIELRTYNTMPYCSCVITDREVRYTPYLMHLRAGSSMMLRLSTNNAISKNLVDHFDAIWAISEERVKGVWV